MIVKGLSQVFSTRCQFW